MSQEEKQKKQVYKGVFISNQRKKRQGGRIKCPQLPNKIQVFGLNQALHESEVEWEEVRRYKKENGKAKESKKQHNKKEGFANNTQAANKNAPEKNLKFKEKIESIQKVKNEVQDSKEDIPTVNTQQAVKSIKQVNNPNKKRKFKPKPKEQKQQLNDRKQTEQKQVKEETHIQAQTTQQVLQTKQEPSAQKPKAIQIRAKQNCLPKEQSKDQANRQGQEEDKANESSEEQDDQSIKNLEIIVGRIKRETNIIYKTKPFVAIMDFQKKRNKRNQKKRQMDDPIQQILQDFYVDIVPIHTRLPRMEMDELVDQNITILSDYAIEKLEFDKKKKRKDELNRIIDSLSNTYIFVTFSDWDGDYPLAKIHKILGKALTINGQCQRFLYQHGLNDLHYEENLSSPKEPLEIQPTVFHQNIDRMVFTIDPATSTDLDDALSIEARGDLYEIGIHIADVSSYLHLIDRQEIVRRTTSVYLPYKVYHMLESHLVKVCSLDPGLYRLAFTVWVTMDLEGNVIGEGKLSKNIVQSRFKLSYEVVQNLITGKMGYEEFNQKYPSTEEQFNSLLEKLLKLAEIAAGHRKKRVIFDVFENRELEFRTDKQKWPIECFIDKRFAAKKMVEEFMIIGNIESARFLVRHQPLNSLVIHHPKPTKLAVNSFNEQFKILQAKFRFENVLNVQKQLQELEQNQKVKDEIKQLCYFRARRIMEPAIYRKYHEIIEENQQKSKEKPKDQPEIQSKANEKAEQEDYPIVHFALGLQFYTHFTSPMRRMADILVHEVLSQVLQGKQPLLIESSEVQKINAGRRSTKRLKKDLNEVYLCLMIHRTKHSLETQGIISSFGMESVSIYIPLFDMQKEVLWRKQFRIHSIHRVRDKDDRLDVKLKHDRVSAKGDVYWVMKKFEKVKLILGCTKSAPLKLTVQMQVQSEKGPFKIQWVE